MKRACDEWQAVRKGGLAKRVIAALVAVAMLGGLGYATASTAVAQDDTTQQQAQQTEQSAKTTSESQDEKTSDSEATSKKAATDETSADGSAENTNTTDADAGVEAQNGADETAVQAANEQAATPVADGGSPESGSLLLDESFKNSTFGESGSWTAKGNACLTAATSGELRCTNTQGSSGIQGADGKGYLQLTDNSGTKKAAVLYDQPVISKSGLHVTFDYYMYGNGYYEGNTGDGISFFLTDGAATLDQTGPEGAALGYATNDEDGTGKAARVEGVKQAVLGIGLDRFGNFSTQHAAGTTARVTGGDDCTQSGTNAGNSVTVRGAGKIDVDGKWNNGYCIVASRTVSSGLGTGTATKDENDNNGKSVDITIDPVTDDSATTQHLTVKIAGEIIIDTNIDRLPDSVKFGFSASTGAAYQVQLIRGLKVYSVNKLSGLDLVKSVNKDTYPDADSHTFNVGDKVPYTFVVRNSGNTTLNNVAVNDPNITNVSCGTDTLAANQQTTCSGTLTLTEDMVDSEGHFTNTATASGTDDEGNAVNSPQASVTIKAIKPLGPPEKHKRIKKNSDKTYTVNVDVTGAANSTTITSTQSVDFTLVLDVSSSMSDEMDSDQGSIKKMTALKSAVNNFLGEAAEINAQPGSKLIRVGLVKFAGKESSKVGDETYTEGRFVYNYSQIVSPLTADMSDLENKVSALRSSGATRADLGFKHASTVMRDARSDAKQVVIFFTDGTPTKVDNFDADVADDAIAYANSMKDNGVIVYSIGVFDSANPASTESRENQFMHAVSSNYPNATTYTDRGEGSNAGYYKAATNASDLNSIFEEIRKSETTTHGFTNVSIEDTLSEYVELSDKNYTVTAKDANGHKVTLKENSDYTLTYDESAKKFTVVFQNMLQDGVTYTLSYNVKPTQKAYDEYALNDGYDGTVGDADTDLDGGATSSGTPGFHSNESACLAYTANNVAHACSDNPYPHPVIQVESSTLTIEKQWEGNGNKPESVTVDVKCGDKVYKTVTLKADKDGEWTADVVIPAGEEKTYTVTETNLSPSWKPSYCYRLYGWDIPKEGNAVTIPESPSWTSATVIITNSSISVASLPLTGGTTDRQWLLIGGGIAGMAMLMIGAAGIWRGKKRLV